MGETGTSNDIKKERKENYFNRVFLIKIIIKDIKKINGPNFIKYHNK